MKNKDMPAMPVTDPRAPAADFPWTTGLTKREYFAGLAMQGYLGSLDKNGDSSWVAMASVYKADSLLKALEGEDGG